MTAIGKGRLLDPLLTFVSGSFQRAHGEFSRSDIVCGALHRVKLSRYIA